MKISRLNALPWRFALSGALIVLALAGSQLYLQGKQTLQRSATQVHQLLSERLSQVTPSQATLVELGSGLPLSFLEVRNQQGDVLAAIHHQTESWLFDTLYPDLYRSVTLKQNALQLSYQPIYPEAEQQLRQLLILLTLTIFFSFGSMLLLIYYIRNQAELALLKELREQQHQGTLFPRVTVEREVQESNLRTLVEQAEHKVLELELRVNQDPLTGLLNRVSFRHDLTELLHQDNQSETALLAIVRASELTSVNQQRGYVSGDQYLQDVAELLERTGKRFSGVRIYRLAGSDFAIVLKHAAPAVAQHLGKELKQQFDSYQLQNEVETVAYTGMTLFRSGQQPEQVLSRGDLALAKAQTSIVNGWFLQETDTEDYLQGESHWKLVITDVIERRAIMLMQQPIQSMNISIRSYTEIFARFLGANNQVMPTETLLAMAQRHDLLIRLEQQIIELIMQHYVTHAPANQRWGINLSANALMNTAFLIWLERQLLRDANVAANLVFEIDEDLLDCNLAASSRLFEMLRRVGSRSSISKFGKGLGSFRLYRELKPDYIKLDPSLINVLERDSAGQQFIRMIVEVSHRLGCVVIAEGVEHVGQKQLLETMYVDAIQGYLIARPAPVSASVSP
ncbi:MAG: EAL domain-containing protein [Aeromonadaceae bacterium]